MVDMQTVYNGVNKAYPVIMIFITAGEVLIK